jgi:dTDP-4-amino-4,6-dideoxygalactose transaminase
MHRPQSRGMSIPFLDLKAMHAELRIELDAAWRQVSRSGQFIGGEFVERFEAEWAEYCGTNTAERSIAWA